MICACNATDCCGVSVDALTAEADSGTVIATTSAIEAIVRRTIYVGMIQHASGSHDRTHGDRPAPLFPLVGRERHSPRSRRDPRRMHCRIGQGCGTHPEGSALRDAHTCMLFSPFLNSSAPGKQRGSLGSGSDSDGEAGTRGDCSPETG